MRFLEAGAALPPIEGGRGRVARTLRCVLPLP